MFTISVTCCHQRLSICRYGYSVSHIDGDINKSSPVKSFHIFIINSFVKSSHWKLSWIEKGDEENTMSSNKKNVHRLNVRPMAVRLDTLIPTVPPQDITTTSEVGITDKKEDNQIKNDSTAAVEDVEVSLNNEDMQVWYRPAYLTNYHVRLPATAFLETASSSSSSPNTDNNAYHTAKNELDTFLRSLHSADKDQDNFFFSKCPLDQCVVRLHCLHCFAFS